MQRTSIQSVVVVFDQPGVFSELLERRFPNVRFTYAKTPQEVASALDVSKPQAVFSIKHTGFPGPAHGTALRYPTVRWFHNGGSGYEHLGPWDTQSVVVTHGAGVLARYLAETVTAEILTLNSNFPEYLDQEKRMEWELRPFHPIIGQTLLIVGLGNIGTFVAQKAKALGMKVIAIGRRKEWHPAVDELYPPEAPLSVVGKADIVSLHVRLTPDTTTLFDEQVFSKMRRGVVFINTSRGPVVDEHALVRSLASGHIGTAYLDVFKVEPLPPESPLWRFPNVLITPHAADAVSNWPERYAELFSENLARWNDGRPLLNQVSTEPNMSSGGDTLR